MKALLEFSLPDESQEHRQAVEAGSYVAAIHTFGEFLFRFDKHRNLNPVERNILEEIRKKWNEGACDLIGIYD